MRNPPLRPFSSLNRLIAALANAHDSWSWEPMFIEPKAQKTTPYPCTTAKDPDGNVIVDEDGKPFAKDYVEPASP